MYMPPSRPVDRLFCRLVQLQKRRLVGKVVRQLLKVRGVDIPPEALRPGHRLVLRHAGNVVVHTKARIGNDVMLHQNVTIGRSDIWQAPSDLFDGFDIQDRVILCANAVVASSTGRLVVAEGTVVGANSVLLTSTGPYEIWAGAPARKVGVRPRVPE